MLLQYYYSLKDHPTSSYLFVFDKIEVFDLFPKTEIDILYRDFLYCNEGDAKGLSKGRFYTQLYQQTNLLI